MIARTMAVYVRPDSPYYWVRLPKTDSLPRQRVRTSIPVHHPFKHAAMQLRRQAEAVYADMMAERARHDHLTRASRLRPNVRIGDLREHRSPDGWCYLYVVQGGDLVKIGHTTRLSSRLKALRTANGTPVTLLALVPAHPAMEKAIHQRFAHLRASGEWFRVDGELLAYIDHLREGKNPLSIIFDAAAASELTEIETWVPSRCFPRPPARRDRSRADTA